MAPSPSGIIIHPEDRGGGHELTGAMVWHAAAAAGADCGAQRGSVCECRRGGAASSSRGRARNTRDRIFDRPRSAPARGAPHAMQCSHPPPLHLGTTRRRRRRRRPYS
ncbi:hypothetical protein BDA96_01G105600 [Sorghum bicolor]|uniref:Uncharacterized protein n=2 Tax=Sorghum bicolor TaxID=4558 RepID=A0A921RWE1_SORBI|nr:hypothetical protein BDA96_01G105600 [Sorghum bicolor]OQU91046.1 hypothetical protein SORBI_3001G101650 [Sorghum bicolor]